MKPPILALFALIALGGCSQRSAMSPTANTSGTPQPRDAQTAQLREKLENITVADDISKSEAELIAECYFHLNVGCGMFTGIRDGDDYWIVDGAFGYAARPIVGFQISKSTGKVTSPIGPSYATPSQMFP